MQDLCIVMARGGSKRVPRKNVRLLKGEPLVSWPVRAAVASNLFQALPGFPWVADLLMSFPEGTNEGYGPIFSDSRADRALVC